jgi:hypothetical protein
MRATVLEARQRLEAGPLHQAAKQRVERSMDLSKEERRLLAVARRPPGPGPLFMSVVAVLAAAGCVAELLTAPESRTWTRVSQLLNVCAVPVLLYGHVRFAHVAYSLIDKLAGPQPGDRQRSTLGLSGSH